ncbi:hypothetical protein ACTXT7_002977 [Hymenolepis weldensis]
MNPIQHCPVKTVVTIRNDLTNPSSSESDYVSLNYTSEDEAVSLLKTNSLSPAQFAHTLPMRKEEY